MGRLVRRQFVRWAKSALEVWVLALPPVAEPVGELGLVECSTGGRVAVDASDQFPE